MVKITLWNADSSQVCVCVCVCVPKMGSMRGGEACGHGHLGLRWNSLWGHGPREGRAKNGSLLGADACERRHLGLRWSSKWGREARGGVPKSKALTHVNAATWTFGGAPSGAAKRVRGAQT